MALYAFGATPIRIIISDKNAEIFNKISNELGADPFDNKHVITFKGEESDIEVFNQVSAIVNGMIELNDGILEYYGDDTDPLQLVKLETL